MRGIIDPDVQRTHDLQECIDDIAQLTCEVHDLRLKIERIAHWVIGASLLGIAFVLILNYFWSN